MCTEQQEQLKLIHEKFKEEVNQHIQECRSTFEAIEEDQLEIKGTVEKQSMSDVSIPYICIYFISRNYTYTIHTHAHC